MPNARPATAEDAPRIARMLHDFNAEFGEPAPEAAVLERRVRELMASGAKRYLVAGDGPDGFAQVAFQPSVWTGRPVGMIDELYVVPARRGRGLGTALLDALHQLAAELGASSLEVVTGEDDTGARRFYERIGFANAEPGSEGARWLFHQRELQGACTAPADTSEPP